MCVLSSVSVSFSHWKLDESESVESNNKLFYRVFDAQIAVLDARSLPSDHGVH